MCMPAFVSRYSRPFAWCYVCMRNNNLILIGIKKYKSNQNKYTKRKTAWWWENKREKMNKNGFLDRNWCIFDLVCSNDHIQYIYVSHAPRNYILRFNKLLLFVKLCAKWILIQSLIVLLLKFLKIKIKLMIISWVAKCSLTG